MRFVDIAAASGYAAVCLSLIVFMNPVVLHQAAFDASGQTSLNHAIAGYIEQVGLPFLTTSSQAAVCASAARASNATLVISAVVDGVPCGSPQAPRAPLATSSLSIDLPGRTLVVEAWLARE